MASLKKVDLPNGETIAYRRREGPGENLVLLHGNMSSSKHWDTFMEELDPRYEVYAMDMRGFGESSYNEPINSLEDLSNDLKLFTDELGLKGFHLMGWSTGGGVAMKFAANHPDYVEKLVLMESVGTKGYPIYRKDENGEPIPDQPLTTKEEIAQDPVQVAPILKAYEEDNKELVKQIWNNLIYTHNKPSPERYDEYLDEILKQRNLVDIDYALVHFNISDEHNGIEEGTGEASDIDAPTLVLWGENDLVVPEEMALDIDNDIGDNADLVYLQGCGHSPLTDDLDQLLDKVESFLHQ
ncbi:MAG: alpha/beta hydrolase [Halobacteria archaeon]|nr:alpha/beta hydrolase [Halobacteria archaeon]